MENTDHLVRKYSIPHVADQVNEIKHRASISMDQLTIPNLSAIISIDNMSLIDM
jgi:hypothetical protein